MNAHISTNVDQNIVNGTRISRGYNDPQVDYEQKKDKEVFLGNMEVEVTTWKQL